MPAHTCDNPKIVGWDDDSLREFDRQWLAGVSVEQMAENFNISHNWLYAIKKRRGLPSRTRTWEGRRIAA